MRKVSFALAFGVVLSGCGGEAKPPQTPAASATGQAPATPEASKEADESKPAETLAQRRDETRRGMIEATNAHDPKKLAGFYTEDAVVKIAGAPADASGREAIAQSWQKLFEAFPDYATAPSRSWIKDDVVIDEWAFRGTHQGDLWGIKGTEKQVGCAGLEVLWFTPEGLVKEHHVYYDGGTVLSQIGISKQKVRPAPALSASPQVFTSRGEAVEAKNVEVAKAMTAAFDAKKEADWLAAMADDLEWDDMSQPSTARGKAEAKRFMKEMNTAFPDRQTTRTNVWAVGDYVIAEEQWTGTHKAPFFGVPATKKPVTIKYADVMQFKDGKLVKGWSYSNGADFMQQLGQAQPPASANAKAAPKK